MFQKPRCLIFFIWPRSFLSENFSLPTKSICFTRALGPSSTTKETCIPDPPTGLASWRTVAKGRPFSASISLMIGLHPPRLAEVVEGVDLEPGLLLLELVLDGGGGQGLAAAVVDDLDALALVDHGSDDLAPVGVSRDVDEQVLHEPGVPEPAEVLLAGGARRSGRPPWWRCRRGTSPSAGTGCWRSRSARRWARSDRPRSWAEARRRARRTRPRPASPTSGFAST